MANGAGPSRAHDAPSEPSIFGAPPGAHALMTRSRSHSGFAPSRRLVRGAAETTRFAVLEAAPDPHAALRPTSRGSLRKTGRAAERIPPSPVTAGSGGNGGSRATAGAAPPHRSRGRPAVPEPVAMHRDIQTLNRIVAAAFSDDRQGESKADAQPVANFGRRGSTRRSRTVARSPIVARKRRPPLEFTLSVSTNVKPAEAAKQDFLAQCRDHFPCGDRASRQGPRVVLNVELATGSAYCPGPHFGGTPEPAAFCELLIPATVSSEPPFAAKNGMRVFLAVALGRFLGVKPDRYYLRFVSSSSDAAATSQANGGRGDGNGRGGGRPRGRDGGRPRSKRGGNGGNAASGGGSSERFDWAPTGKPSRKERPYYTFNVAEDVASTPPRTDDSERLVSDTPSPVPSDDALMSPAASAVESDTASPAAIVDDSEDGSVAEEVDLVSAQESPRERSSGAEDPTASTTTLRRREHPRPELPYLRSGFVGATKQQTSTWGTQYRSTAFPRRKVEQPLIVRKDSGASSPHEVVSNVATLQLVGSSQLPGRLDGFGDAHGAKMNLTVREVISTSVVEQRAVASQEAHRRKQVSPVVVLVDDGDDEADDNAVTDKATTPPFGWGAPGMTNVEEGGIFGDVPTVEVAMDVGTELPLWGDGGAAAAAAAASTTALGDHPSATRSTAARARK